MDYQIKLEHSKDNNIIPLVNDFTIHSKYSPKTEGDKLAESILIKNLSEDMPILVLGLGFAYHIKRLTEKFKTIYVAESLKELIESAKKQDFLKEIFQKIILIEDLTQLPYLKEFETLTLRSEQRFQENFFNEVVKRVQINKSTYHIANDELRVLIDYPIYGGSYTSAEYVKRAFEQLNCQVKIMDNSIANPMLQYMLDMEKYKDTVIPKLNELMTDLLWEQYLSYKPHILFCLAQAPISPHIIKAIRQSGTLVIFWFVEDFRRFPYWQEVCQYVDYFLHIQKGEFSNLLNKQQFNVNAYLPMACEPETHKKLPDSHIKAIYKSDLSFMGAAFLNRVNFFRHLKAFNLKLWGSGWELYDDLANHCMLNGRRIDIQESVEIYNGSKININLHSSMDNEIFDPWGDFINPRTFEICSCGAFQLVDDRPAIREIFTPDQNIVVFSSIEEAIDKIEFYLKYPDLREKIANKGHQLVLEKHSYKHRIAEILSFVQNNSPILKAKVENEHRQVQEILDQINDNNFSEIMNKIPAGLRNSYKMIIQQIKQNSSSLKDYEAIILLLESFIKGE